MAENTVSMMMKMGDEYKVDDMVEVVYWDDVFYECDTNRRAIQQMNQILSK